MLHQAVTNSRAGLRAALSCVCVTDRRCWVNPRCCMVGNSRPTLCRLQHVYPPIPLGQSFCHLIWWDTTIVATIFHSPIAPSLLYQCHPIMFYLDLARGSKLSNTTSPASTRYPVIKFLLVFSFRDAGGPPTLIRKISHHLHYSDRLAAISNLMTLQMLRDWLIEPSTRPFTSPILLVKKKDSFINSPSPIVIHQVFQM